MTTEPFRYDQQVLDVSDMNMTSGLRNSLNPLASTFRLGLSSDLLSSHDVLGRSADGTSLVLGSDGGFGSSPSIMASHQRSMAASSQLTPPLSASLLHFQGANGAQSVLPIMSNAANREGPFSAPVTETNMGASRDPYLGGPRTSNPGGPQPVIQVPAGLASTGPTLNELALAGGASDADGALRAVQQAALQTPPSPFNMAQYLQSQSPAPSSATTPSGVVSTTASGQLRFSGDRFATSAFSPVSPGGTTPVQKLPTNPFSPVNTPGGHILSPLAHNGSNSRPGSASESMPGSATPSFTPSSMGSTPVSTPPPAFMPPVQYPHNFEALARASADSLNVMNGAGLPHSMPYHPSPSSPFGASPGPSANKRPFLGTPVPDQPHMTAYPMSVRSGDSTSEDSTSRGTPSNPGFLSNDEMRSHTLLQSLSTFNNAIGLANNAVKQENMVHELTLGQGAVLQGPASAAFSYQGKAIPYTEEGAMQHYMRQEEAKKAELGHIQTQIARQRAREASANGGDDNYLSESHMEHKKNKKMHPLTYDALYRALVANVDGTRERYLLNEHPQVGALTELPGLVYFLLVAKGSRKPPHVGFPFRSYSDSHYTSVDRDTPIICKVKEWPVDNDPKNIWRLYHYYLGNKKRAPRKRKRDDSDID